MINLMKQHPYKTIITAFIVVAIAAAILCRAEIAHGALRFSVPPLYNSAPAPIIGTTTGEILDGTSTEDFTDATPIQNAKSVAQVEIKMSAKAQLIIQIKQQIASLQNELALLEAD